MNSEQVNQIIPESWLWTDLDNISVLVTGKTPSTIVDEYWNGSIPFVTPSQIKASGEMLPSQRNLTILGSEKARIIPENSILIVCIGSVGKIGLLDKPSIINQQLNALIPIDPLIPKFLYYWSKYFLQSWVIENASATVNAAILNKSRLGKAPIPLPPLNEQRRIVSTIEQLTDRSHKARAALEDVPKLIAQFRQSVLAAAFRGDLTADWREKNPDIEPASELLGRIKIDRRKRWENSSKSQYKPPQDIETDRLPKLPDSWSWGSLDQLLYSLRNGLSRKPADEMPGIPILRISALRSMNLDTDDIRFYRPQDNENLESYFLDEGDLLFTRYNGNREFVGVCGRVNQISGKLLHPDKLIRGRIISGDLFDSHFLEIVCNSGISKKHIESYVKTSAGQHGISGSDLKTTPIPIPPIYEQRKIVEIVTMQLSTIKSIEDIAASYFIDSQQLDRSILAKAFRGELVPQDLNDEPASVLLERIRAEREQTSTPKQRGKTTRKNSSKQLSIDLE
jgi:type I restriction enzyme, S subunit